MEKNKEKIVILKIPPSPEFVGVVRLTLSGIASRMNFSYDEIEDLKIAVAEACNNAIQHAYANADSRNSVSITIKFTINQKYLEIDVIDKGEGFDVKKQDMRKTRPQEEGGMGIFLIKALVDEASFSSSNEGTQVKMIKYLK